MKRSKQETEELARKVFDEIQAGVPMIKAVKKYGIHASSYYVHRKHFMGGVKIHSPEPKTLTKKKKTKLFSKDSVPSPQATGAVFIGDVTSCINFARSFK